MNILMHVSMWWRNISILPQVVECKLLCKCSYAQLTLHWGHYALLASFCPFACFTLQARLMQMASDGFATSLHSGVVLHSPLAQMLALALVWLFSSVEYRTGPAQMLGLARGPSPTKHETGKSSHQVAPPPAPSTKLRKRKKEGY